MSTPPNARLHRTQTLQPVAQRGHSSVGDTDEELASSLFAEEAAGLLSVTQGPLTVLEELEEMVEVARYAYLVALAISQGTPIPPKPARRQRGAQQTTSSASQGVPSTSRPLPQPRNVQRPSHPVASTLPSDPPSLPFASLWLTL